MLKPPIILYFSAASEALPVLAAIIRRHQITASRAWILVWCGIQIVDNVIGKYLGFHHINNHPITYVALPLQGAAILWALSLWQLRPVARLTLRLIIPAFLVAWVVLVLGVEDLFNFSAVAEPVYSLLALGAALFTLLTRSSDASEPLLRQDWFLICSGLALHFSALAVLTPLSAAFVRSDPELVSRAYEVRGAINILSFVIIAAGMLCLRPIPSGPSFSPRSSA